MKKGYILVKNKMSQDVYIKIQTRKETLPIVLDCRVWNCASKEQCRQMVTRSQIGANILPFLPMTEQISLQAGNRSLYLIQLGKMQAKINFPINDYFLT